MPVRCACLYCETVFYTQPSHIARGEGKFCSRTCYGKSLQRTDEQLFLTKIQKTETCWLWTGKRNRNEYGVTHHYKLAHRLSWEMHFGPIPNQMSVCHKCDNPPCVNPEHLFLGTMKENMDDKVSKGRQFKKLTTKLVKEIREQYKPGKIRMKDLAIKYKVSTSLISIVIRREVWNQTN